MVTSYYLLLFDTTVPVHPELERLGYHSPRVPNIGLMHQQTIWTIAGIAAIVAGLAMVIVGLVVGVPTRRPVVLQYEADLQRATKSLTAVIARLGYTVKTVDKENGLVIFQTGMSMWSLAGQRMSAHVLDVGKSVQITIGGTMNATALLQVYDWGESTRIAAKVFKELDTVLGPGGLISGSLSTAGDNAVAVVVIAGLVILVLAMASR